MTGSGVAASTSGPLFTWQSYCSKQSSEWQLFSPALITGELIQKNELPPFSPLKKLSSVCKPNRAEWEKKIRNALWAIQTGELDKVVIAKRIEVDCERLIDPLALFSALKKPGQTNFFLQVASHTAFLGSSPERLYKREGRFIECDALAGTRSLCTKEELLTSEKDLREFGIVKERIAGALRPLSQSKVQISPVRIACTPTVGHLYAKISATLKDEIDDRMILSALHPTPALGGWPKKTAAAWQRKHEPFARGLYGAPIGYYSKEKAEFAVAIRSCLVVDSRVYLFAGTGIVQGSDPALEWEESEQKLVQWESLFYG